MSENRARVVPQLQLRTAIRARVGLRMKTPVARIVVLRRTLRTHLENSHRGAQAVIRQPFDDAEARTTVGAVGKRITIPAVAGIEDFSLTIRTCRNVRQDQCRLGAAGTL